MKHLTGRPGPGGQRQWPGQEADRRTRPAHAPCTMDEKRAIGSLLVRTSRLCEIENACKPQGSLFGSQLALRWRSARSAEWREGGAMMLHGSRRGVAGSQAGAVSGRPSGAGSFQSGSLGRSGDSCRWSSSEHSVGVAVVAVHVSIVVCVGRLLSISPERRAPLAWINNRRAVGRWQRSDRQKNLLSIARRPV
jgi:hypothetical protein